MEQVGSIEPTFNNNDNYRISHLTEAASWQKK
jgi:hypothetical protein